MQAKKKKKKTAIPSFHLRSPCPSLIINACALINEYFPRGSVAVVHEMTAGSLRRDNKLTVKAIKNHETWNSTLI